MNGIDNVTARLLENGRAEAAQIIAAAEAEAAENAASFAKKAETEAAAILEKAAEAAKAAAKRTASRANIEGRNLELAARQRCISAAFDRALEMLRGLPAAEYGEAVASLCSGKLAGCTELRVLLTANADRAGLEKAMSDMLAEAGSQAKLEFVKNAGDGGAVIISGGVEQNLTFSALLRDRRESLEPETVSRLFGNI